MSFERDFRRSLKRQREDDILCAPVADEILFAIKRLAQAAVAPCTLTANAIDVKGFRMKSYVKMTYEYPAWVEDHYKPDREDGVGQFKLSECLPIDIMAYLQCKLTRMGLIGRNSRDNYIVTSIREATTENVAYVVAMIPPWREVVDAYFALYPNKREDVLVAVFKHTCVAEADRVAILNDVAFKTVKRIPAGALEMTLWQRVKQQRARWSNFRVAFLWLVHTIN
jgi:hypothetical protein